MKSSALLASAVLAFASFSLFAPRLAAAQPSLTAPAAPPRNAEIKDPPTATLLAVAPVLVGGGLAAAAFAHDGDDSATAYGLLGYATLTFGPSLGHYYTGDTGRGLATTGVRLGATGLGIAGAI